MNILKIYIHNPYHENTYKTKEYTLDTFKQIMGNVVKGYESAICFTDVDGKYVCLSPGNIASIEVEEIKEKVNDK